VEQLHARLAARMHSPAFIDENRLDVCCSEIDA